MLDTLILNISHLVEGLTSTILHNYKLNDNNANARRDNNNLEEPLLVVVREAPTENIPDDLSDNDNVYEEYAASAEQDENGFSWKNNRPSLRHSFFEAYVITTYMICCGLFIGSVVATLVFLDINSGNACHSVPWYSIPLAVQRVRVSVQVLENLAAQLLHFLLLVVVFGYSLVARRLDLLFVNIVFGFFDTVYRLFLQVFGLYGASWKDIPSHLLLLVTVYNSYTLAKHFAIGFTMRKTRWLLSFQFGMQFYMGILVLDFTSSVLIPWYLKLEDFNQALLVTMSPIFGEIVKTVCRLFVQHVHPACTHAGKSYYLVICLYVGTTLVNRTLQAGVSSFQIYILLALGHAFVGVFDRLSVVLRDYLMVYLYRVCLRKSRRRVWIGQYRTARTQRLISDMIICNILHEILAIVYTNAFLYLREKRTALHVLVPRVMAAIGIEFVFTGINVVILTRYMNIPVFRLWRLQWKSYLCVNMLTSVVLTLYITQYLIEVVNSKNKTFNNGAANDTCQLANLLFFR